MSRFDLLFLHVSRHRVSQDVELVINYTFPLTIEECLRLLSLQEAFFKHDSARSTLTELAVLVELERKVGNRDPDQPGVSQ